MSRGVRLVFLGLILLVVASLALSGFAISRSSELSGKIAELNKQNAQLSSLSKTFGPRTATIVVAAANSRSKGQADFTADNKDDQKAIQAAIDSLPTNGGKVILLEGTYNITAPIKITKPYVYIEGMGGGEGGGPTSAPTTIRLADGANSNAIESPDTKDHTLVLKDLTLDGNRSKNNSGNGIVLNYLQLGTMAEPSTGVEIWNFAENGLKATTPITSIFAQFLYVRGNGKSGILANMIQGSLMSEVYLTTNFAGISAATNDTIISGLYLESNIGWGGTLSLTTSVARIWTKSNGWAGLYLSGDNSIVDLWAANNVQASDSPVAAEVYLYGATNLTLNLNVDGSSQKKPNINGLYMQNNVSGNVIKGHIGASGFGIFLDASSSGWNPAGTTIEGVVIAGSMGGFNTIPPASMIVRNNTGYVTENSGAVTVPIGNSSVIVEHGLADTPVSIQLTPISDTGGKRYWVSQKDSSTFTIAIDSRYSNPIPFTWKAEMY